MPSQTNQYQPKQEVFDLKKNKNKKPMAILGTKSGRCPYCGSPVSLRSADGIYKDNRASTMLYICSRYPACDAYVRIIPETTTPAGSMANGSLRSLRIEAHKQFDKLHLTKIMTRKEAYAWLAAILQSPLSQAHIGHLSEYYCKQVITESTKLLDNRRKAQGVSPEHKACQAARGSLHAAR